MSPTNPSARLDQIAQAAGVSSATVSRVVNNKPGVADSTRQAVLRAIDALGYQRPANLQRAVGGTIGLIIPELDNPIFPAFAQALTNRLAAQGYTAVLAPTSAGGVQEDAYLSMLMDRGVAGLIYVSGRHADTGASVQRQIELIDQGMRMVLINGHREELEAPSWSTDDAQAMWLAVEHLADLGHRDLGLALGPARYQPSARKHRAFKAACRARGVTGWVEHSWFSVQGGEIAARALLAKRTSGLVCASDMMALGAIRAARAEGYNVPQDVSVVGFDGSLMTQYTNPPLTTLRQDVEALASGAVATLVSALKGDELPVREALLTPELVVRGSTAPPSGRLGQLDVTREGIP